MHLNVVACSMMLFGCKRSVCWDRFQGLLLSYLRGFMPFVIGNWRWLFLGEREPDPL